MPFTCSLVISLLSAVIMCTANRPHLDCLLSDWSQWGKCSSVCSEGKRTRTRYITQNATSIFSVDCHPIRREEKDCGSPKNGCEMFCVADTGRCLCETGYELGNDEKSCFDRNECAPNEGLGSCSQKCQNLPGTYECSCHNGFKLAPDGHDCIYNSSIVCPHEMSTIHGSDTCVCKNGLEGDGCDRNITFCRNKYVCQKGDLCVSFIHSLHKCITINNQVPILLRMTSREYMTANIKHKVERYVQDILEGYGNGKSLDNLDGSGKRQATSGVSSFYVEGSNATKVKSFTYLKFIVFDVQNHFQEVSSDKICPLLESSDIRCLTQDDCKRLNSAGIACPSNLKEWKYNSLISRNTAESNTKIKSWVYILISGFVAIIILLIILLFLYLKRGKSPHNHLISDNFNNNVDQPVTFSTGYNHLSQSDSLRWSDIGLSSHNSYPDTRGSCSDGNMLYNYSGIPKVDVPIYESIENIKSYVESEECEEPHYKIPIKTESCMGSTDSIENLEKSCDSKMVVDLSTGDEEPRYSTPPGRKKY